MKYETGELTFTTLWANSADNKLLIYFLFYPRKQDLTNPDFWEKSEKDFKMSGAENFTQTAKH